MDSPTFQARAEGFVAAVGITLASVNLEARGMHLPAVLVFWCLLAVTAGLAVVAIINLVTGRDDGGSDE